LSVYDDEVFVLISGLSCVRFYSFETVVDFDDGQLILVLHILVFEVYVLMQQIKLPAQSKEVEQAEFSLTFVNPTLQSKWHVFVLAQHIKLPEQSKRLLQLPPSPFANNRGVYYSLSLV